MKTLFIFFSILILVLSQSNRNDCSISIVGGGLSGVYSAYRLATDNNSPYKGKGICLFEALDRFGGRVLSITQKEVPELGNAVIDAGFYRYHTSLNPITRALVEDVFKLPSECYFHEYVVGKSKMERSEDRTESNREESNELIGEKGTREKKIQRECMVKNFYYILRNKWITLDNFNVENLPYTFSESDTTHIKGNTSLLDPFGSFTKICEVVNTALTSIGEIPKEGEESTTSTTSTTSTIKLGEWKKISRILSNMLNLKYQEIPLQNLALRSFMSTKLNISEEFYNAVRDIQGIPNLELYFSSDLGYIAYQCALRQGFGEGFFKRINHKRGYYALIDMMLKEAEKNGVKLFNLHQLTRISKVKNIEKLPLESEENSENSDKTNVVPGRKTDVEPIKDSKERIMLHFLNKDKAFISNKVILAIGKHQLDRLDAGSVIFKDNETLNTFEALREFGSYKIYLHYNKVWWNKIIGNHIISSNFLRNTRFFSGPIICDDEVKTTYEEKPVERIEKPVKEKSTEEIPVESIEKPTGRSTTKPIEETRMTSSQDLSRCSGFLEVSYSYGDLLHNLVTEVFDDEITEKSSPFIILRNSDPRFKVILKRIHNELMQNVKYLNITQKVKEPELGIYIQWIKDPWFRTGVIVEPHKVNPEKFLSTFLEPVKGLPIHMVNLDFSGDMGWENNTDSNFMMAERMLKQYFQLEKPKFIEDNLYKNFIIGEISKKEVRPEETKKPEEETHEIKPEKLEVPVKMPEETQEKKPEKEILVEVPVSKENLKLKETPVKKTEEETVKEPEEETVKKPEEETVKKPEEETVKKPEEETAKKPEEETVKKPEEETLKKPKEETVKKPEETLKKPKETPVRNEEYYK